MTAIAANVLVILPAPASFCLTVSIYDNLKAGGMVLPTLAGSNQIWCGGEDESIIPDTSVTGNGVTEKLLVNYSISSLTFFSGGCSLQGTPTLVSVLDFKGTHGFRVH